MRARCGSARWHRLIIPRHPQGGSRGESASAHVLFLASGPGALRCPERNPGAHCLLLYRGGGTPKLLRNLTGWRSCLRKPSESLQLTGAPGGAVVRWTSCHHSYSAKHPTKGRTANHTPSPAVRAHGFGRSVRGYMLEHRSLIVARPAIPTCNRARAMLAARRNGCARRADSESVARIRSSAGANIGPVDGECRNQLLLVEVTVEPVLTVVGRRRSGWSRPSLTVRPGLCNAPGTL